MLYSNETKQNLSENILSGVVRMVVTLFRGNAVLSLLAAFGYGNAAAVFLILCLSLHLLLPITEIKLICISEKYRWKRNVC